MTIATHASRPIPHASLLITGGNSWVARAVIAALAPDVTIRALDTHFAEPLPDGVDVCSGDIRDPAIVAAALDGIDTVLHLSPLSVTASTGDEMAAALDRAARGTYVLMNAVKTASVDRVVLGSTLALFERLPAEWRVMETWRPRLNPELAPLCAWLAELSARELARSSRLQMLCLRFGRIVDDNQVQGQPYDPRWLHVDDAIMAVRCALAYQAPVPRRPDWSIFHIPAPGARARIRLSNCASTKPPFNYQPSHDFVEYPSSAPHVPGQGEARSLLEVLAPQTLRSRPIRKVVILGAGGPLGAAAARELCNSYTLRLADRRSLTDIAAEAKPQSLGAPVAAPLDPPHENRIVDVRDAAQVLAACAGMDAIVNCSVQRNDHADAFRVNTVGACNMMRAAVAHGIRRVVQTGPLLVTVPGNGDYPWDYDLHVDAPPRPFGDLYHHTKYLGQEICRVYADYYGLEVPVLQFAGLINPGVPGGRDDQFIVSWQDAARAIRCALEVPSLPSPWEPLFILTDPPQARFDNTKARRVLNWQPRDLLEHFWRDPPSA